MFLKLLGTETRLYPLIAANRTTSPPPSPASVLHRRRHPTLIRFDRLYTYEVEGVKATGWLRALAEGEEMASVSCGSAAACEREPGR